MTNEEIREALRQMLKDWNNATEAQRASALKAAGTQASQRGTR